ncbi:hypothetical protein [Microbacterium sp. SSM24]|uniref:hypothetical protein n=1 Tax=Microbacterium sp. SSM24 TaxID=2991714 RepID=UPI002227BF8F|nr:hypothetical protein [Microbacterium sp. SSM24]MCW3491824.1 hypothetical protein [Microbacterium sp. SSM24]
MSDPAEPTNPQPAPPATAPEAVGNAVPAATQAPAPGAWAAPSAPPFGTPGAPPAQGYAMPVGYAPPAGFTPPAGYGPGPAPAPGSASAYGQAAARPTRRGLGVVALVVAVIATVGAALVAAVAAFSIGLGTGREIALMPSGSDFEWAVLTPVRDSVLLAEVAFWVGTALGLWALVQGVIALVKDRGRGFAIAAVVIAALGPVVFFVVLQGFLTAGYAAGSSIGG